MIHINDAWDSSICQLKLTNLWKPARLDNSAAFIELSRPHPVRGEGISPIEAAFLMPYSHCPAYLATGYFWYHDSELRKENALGWRGRLSNQVLVIYWGVWVMQMSKPFTFPHQQSIVLCPFPCACRTEDVCLKIRASGVPAGSFRCPYRDKRQTARKLRSLRPRSSLISPSGLIKLIWELSLRLTIEKHGTEVR